MIFDQPEPPVPTTLLKKKHPERSHLAIGKVIAVNIKQSMIKVTRIITINKWKLPAHKLGAPAQLEVCTQPGVELLQRTLDHKPGYIFLGKD